MEPGWSTPRAAAAARWDPGPVWGRRARALGGPGLPPHPRALLKVAQTVSLLIAFICVRSSPWISQSAYRYFEVVTICNLIMILAFYLVHLFRLYRVLACISWLLSIFGFVATFLCLASVWLSYEISRVTQPQMQRLRTRRPPGVATQAGGPAGR